MRIGARWTQGPRRFGRGAVAGVAAALMLGGVPLLSAVPALSSAPLTLTGTPTSPVTAQAQYSFALTVSGGSAAPTVTLTAGALPSGLTLSPAGVISGTPTTAGSFTATATATDGGADPPASDTFTIAVRPLVSVVPSTGAPGTPVTVSGSAFAAGESVLVLYTVDPTTVPPTKATLCSKVPATGSGTFSCNASIPAAAGSPGAHSIFATGSVSRQSGSAKFTLTPGPLKLTGTPASPATKGISYSSSLTVSGGTGSPSVALTAGSLPPGLGLSPAGVISGTPTTVGTYTATATATDGGADPPSSDSFSITIAAPPALSLNGTPTSAATLGVAYAFSFTVTGGAGTPTVGVVGGRLAPGLSLSPGGTISGTPTRAGTWYTLVAATDGGADPPAYQQFGITVGLPPALSLTGVPTSPVTAAAAYSFALTVSGGSGVPTVAVTSGSLPPGLTLSSAGVISGTPTLAGKYTATATATDGGADPPSSDTFTILVRPVVGVSPGTGAPGTPVTVSGSAFVAGESVTVTYIVDALAVPPTKTTLCSSVPAASDGTFSCSASIPSAASAGVAGAHSLFATGSVSRQSGSAKFTLSASGTLQLTGTPTSPAPNGSAYSFTFTVAGGSGTPTVAITSGSLPPGLSLSTAGVLSGTPTTPGTYTATATASDGVDTPSSDTFTITIT